MRLSQTFYAQPTRRLAKALLGCRLVRNLDGQRVSGVIVETEAYIGENDLACHARAGRTARTEVMYGRPGLAYVYFTYGLHWLLNVVSECEDYPAAVLIRAIEPVDGVAAMQAARGQRPIGQLTNGPAKVCQALRIDRAMNGVDLTDARSDLWIEADRTVPARSIGHGPRVGIGRTPEPWLSKPWRYRVKDNPFVSK
ncbi:MAG: DNA-3-methyladenine glycosylase [Chloroflexi bacterium]|nr:DNA-3-methyladenine glycosylase [Chloroflexota bacterium]